MNTLAITLEPESAAAIRRMLLIGLSSYCEVDRLCDAMEDSIERGIGDIPASCCPTHPTRDAETVSQFAEALRLLG